jgi:hypothetical protein
MENKEIDAMKLIEKITFNDLDKEKVNENENENEEAGKFDYAKSLNLRGLIYLENGYNSKAINYFKLAEINFKEISEDPFDPFILNNKLDEIVAMIFFTNNFEELRNLTLNIISQAKLLDNDFLYFKGLLSLVHLHNFSGNIRHAYTLADYSLKLAEKKNFTDNFIISKLLYIYISNISFNKKIYSKNNYIKKINKECGNIIIEKINEFKEIKKDNENSNKNKNSENLNKNNPKDDIIKLNGYNNNNLIALIFYKFSDFYFLNGKLAQSLFFIENAISHLEQKNLKEINLVNFYIKKWAILSYMGRENTSEYLIEFTQKLINKFYTSDSLKNLEYLRFIQITSSILSPPRDEIVNEIIKKTKKVNDIGNINNLLQKYFNIISTINIGANIPDLVENYKEFNYLQNEIFQGKHNELRKDIKDTVMLSGLGKILRAN